MARAQAAAAAAWPGSWKGRRENPAGVAPAGSCTRASWARTSGGQLAPDAGWFVDGGRAGFARRVRREWPVAPSVALVAFRAASTPAGRLWLENRSMLVSFERP